MFAFLLSPDLDRVDAGPEIVQELLAFHVRGGTPVLVLKPEQEEDGSRCWYVKGLSFSKSETPPPWDLVYYA